MSLTTGSVCSAPAPCQSLVVIPFQQPWSSRKPDSVGLWPNLPVQLGQPPIPLLKYFAQQFLLKGEGQTQEPHNLSELLLSPLWEGQHRCKWGWIRNLWSEPLNCS